MKTIRAITAILLDAIITVPFFVQPQGGNYREFFGAPAFWLIASEIVLIILTYYHFRVKQPLLSN
jgi:hypothetical protein